MASRTSIRWSAHQCANEASPSYRGSYGKMVAPINIVRQKTMAP